MLLPLAAEVRPTVAEGPLGLQLRQALNLQLKEHTLHTQVKVQ
jgi:hypothetical protein